MKRINKLIRFTISYMRIFVINMFYKNVSLHLGFNSIISCNSRIELNTSRHNASLFIGRSSRILNNTCLRISNSSLELGRHCELNHAKIQANGGKIKIGDNVFFNSGCIVISTSSIEIGDGSAFGTNVSIYDHDHIYVKNGPQPWNENKSTPIKIGKNCWIGCNTIILRGSCIGDNCVIAAGTIIKGSIPDHTLVYNEKNIIMKEIQ